MAPSTRLLLGSGPRATRSTTTQRFLNPGETIIRLLINRETLVTGTLTYSRLCVRLTIKLRVAVVSPGAINSRKNSILNALSPGAACHSRPVLAIDPTVPPPALPCRIGCEALRIGFRTRCLMVVLAATDPPCFCLALSCSSALSWGWDPKRALVERV